MKDHEFLPDAVEVFQRPPSPLGRTVVWLVGLFVVITVLWFTFSRTDVVVTATGKVIPSGNVKTVQAANEGVIRKIHVHDGQQVDKGTVLLELDTTLSRADIEKLQQDFIKAELEVRRLQAQIAGDLKLSAPESAPLDLVHVQNALLVSQTKERQKKVELAKSEIIRYEADYAATLSEVEKLRQTVPILEKKYQEAVINGKRGLIAGIQVTDAEIRYIEAKTDLEVIQHRLKEVAANLQSAKDKKSVVDSEYESELSEQITEATHERNTVKQELIKATKRNAQQMIIAPVSGVVQQLSMHTEGGVVEVADPLLVIVPQDAGLEVEAKIINRDSGFVTLDQPVLVKVNAYEFTRYGMIDGVVKWVGRDAVEDKDLGAVYPARIALKSIQTPNSIDGKRGLLAPGMSVVNDVVIGKRRLIEYFLGPIMRYKDESLRER